MKKILYILCSLIFLFSCEKGTKFIIEGDVKNASGSTLYLEQVGVYKTNPIDSVKLNAKGNFKFKKERPALPGFYRLKLNKQFIDLAIDSTETIKITAGSTTFAKDYTVEGSENCQKIKELSILRTTANNTLNKIDKSFEAKEINQEEFMNQSLKAINAYKETAKKYIFEDPSSTVAYYALLQTINGLIIFSPYEKDDNHIYGAVATQWDIHYPESEFSKQVKNLSLQGMRALRAERQPLEYKVEKAINLFDVNLPTISGNQLQLSKVAPGKVTLLEFCSYATKGSPEHNMELARIYEKYKNKGFQIFQVSVEPDEHEWKNVAVNLPWMCVRDPESIYSETLRKYNVKNLPTGFILDKDGEIVLRVDSYKNLESNITNYLK